MLRSGIALVVALLMSTFTAGVAAQDEQELKDLKERMASRYRALFELVEAGKLGETHAGLIEAVKADHRKEPVDLPGGKKGTVGQLVDDENKDRRRVYELMAKKNGATAEAVARNAGELALKKADPEHYFKTVDGKWVQKKDVK